MDLHAIEKKIYIFFISRSIDSRFVTPLGFRLEKRQENVNKAMFAIYRITLAPARKPYRVGLFFTHKNDDFGAISVTEGSCPSPISKVKRHIWRIGSAQNFGAVLV